METQAAGHPVKARLAGERTRAVWLRPDAATDRPPASGPPSPNNLVWVDNMRVVAAFAVVLPHVAAASLTQLAPGSVIWWSGVIYDSLCHWCVPVFIMLTGYLLGQPGKIGSVGEFYRKRMHRLLVPWLAWSLFYVAWSLVALQVKHKPFEATELARSLLEGRPYYHLWYLYMLVGLYCFAPWVLKMTAALTDSELLMLVGLGLVFSMACAPFDYLNSIRWSLFLARFVHYLPFFLAGTYLARREISIDWRAGSLIFAVSALGTALGTFALARWTTGQVWMYFLDSFSVTVVPTSLAIFLLLKKCTKPLLPLGLTKSLAAASLGIYCIHPVFIDVGTYFGLTSKHPSLWFTPLAALLVFALSAAASQAMLAIPYLRRAL